MTATATDWQPIETADAPLVALWSVTAAEGAFGARIQWPGRRDPRIDAVPHNFKTVANALFCEGGKIADHGLQLKGGVDRAQFHGCLRAVLCSFEPSHEVKEAVAGSLLQHYCEPLPAPPATKDA